MDLESFSIVQFINIFLHRFYLSYLIWEIFLYPKLTKGVSYVILQSISHLAFSTAGMTFYLWWDIGVQFNFFHVNTQLSDTSDPHG